MTIGIDARLMYETGVGRYIRNLLRELIHIDKENSYVLYVCHGTSMPFQLPNRWRVRVVAPRWHSAGEQVYLPYEYMKDKLDLLHVPYFTVPLLYPGNVVVTIHDITILRVATGMATTLPSYMYHMKRLGYRIVLESGLKKAKHIFSVSESTKKDICKTLGVSRGKVSVTYEGIDYDILPTSLSQKSPLPYPYLLYVGNAYPHKNLDTLCAALQIYISKDQEELKRRKLKLVCIGKDDYFYRRLKQKAQDLGVIRYMHFPGEVSDLELGAYYTHAEAVVSPSFAEGFALPPLEALYCDTPVIASDIPVFRELLLPETTFINPYLAAEWYGAFKMLSGKKKIWSSKTEKEEFFSRYSWNQMARQTLKGYQSIQ